MQVLRCILAGVVSLVVGSVLVFLAAGLILSSGLQEPVAISVDVVAWARSPYLWLVAMALFGIGFWLQSRRE